MALENPSNLTRPLGVTQTPILSLEAARQRRAERAAQLAARKAPIATSSHEGPQQEDLRLLVHSERLSPADLFAMIRLGIVTDSVDMLPCADPHRHENATDWEQDYNSGERGALPYASQVSCPLLAQATTDRPPACIEALRLQAETPRWHPEKGFVLPSPLQQDPVVERELRPCLLLSKELFRHVLVPLCQDKPGPCP